MVRDREFTVADVRRVLRKHWWIIPVCGVGCAALSASVARQLPKKYTSQAVVLVGLPTSTTAWDVYFLGSCLATDALSAAQPTPQTGMIHQCLRRTLLTSATVNSRSRTIHVPFYSVTELHASCH